MTPGSAVVVDLVARVQRVLGAVRFRYRDEAMLQRLLLEVLRADGLDVTPEVDLGDAGRIDFVVTAGSPLASLGADGGLQAKLGVEVKVRGGGTAAAVLRQLQRYAASGLLDALAIVTDRSTLTHQLPHHLGGQTIYMILLNGISA